MPRVVGIDCGGTTIRAVALENGREIWSGEGGSAQIAWGQLDQLRTSLADVLEGCPEADAVCGAFAGMVSEGHRDQAMRLLSERFGGDDVLVVPDYEAALEASDGADICLIAGTGSVLCSRRADGSVAKSGGRGYVLGDEGSAFQYGREALLHYLDDPEDDISSRLRDAVEAAFGTLKRSEIIANLYASRDVARRVASLLPAFAGDASEGAIYALKALKVHAGKLAHLLAVHIREELPAETRTVRVACHGGVWKHAALCHAFADQVRFWVDADEVILDFEPPAPVLGAARLAGRLIEK